MIKVYINLFEEEQTQATHEIKIKI